MSNIISYEKALGGNVEDIGFDRYSVNDVQDSRSLFTDLVSSAEANTSLENMGVRFGEMRMDLDTNGFPYLDSPHSKPLYLSPWGMTQLSEKMGMGGAGYVKKCMVNNMNDLVPTNVNRWIEKNAEKNVVLRIHSGSKDTVRSVVSDRYGFFDHTDALAALHEVFLRNDLSHLKIESSSVYVDDMALRIVDPEQVIVRGNGTNDKSTIGMQIRNGQTGRVCVSVDFMVYTSICTNGLFIGADRSNIFRQKHFNVSTRKFQEDFHRAVERFPDYIAAVRRYLEASRSLPLTRLFSSEEQIFNFVKKHTRLPYDKIEVVSSIQEANWEPNLWGLAGAVTQYAQQVGNSDLQFQLETQAGAMIENGLKVAA